MKARPMFSAKRIISNDRDNTHAKKELRKMKRDDKKPKLPPEPELKVETPDQAA